VNISTDYIKFPESFDKQEIIYLTFLFILRLKIEGTDGAAGRE
jgi:hypothetical protein